MIFQFISSIIFPILTAGVLHYNFSSYTHEQLSDIQRVYLQCLTNLFFKNLFVTLSSIATVASYIIVAAFILFYLLKDDAKFALTLDLQLPKI